MKSAHREITFWHYTQPTRSTFGFHLRAATPEARFKLATRLEELAPAASMQFHFGELVPDPLGSSRDIKKDVTFVIGMTPASGEGVSLAIDDEQCALLVDLLKQGVTTESCVTVFGRENQVPLWIWPDP
ncbi:MAG: hypothetical protein HKN18_08240 [Silicimonas sp.]|nr:hypothetical protein [Silicimonas sp.]